MDKDTIFTHAREYLHIYVETGELKPASKALKRAYQELTGSNPMYLKGKNSRGEKTYANTREYKTVKQIYLPRLERLVRAMLMERSRRELQEYLDSEVERGVDLEALRDIGF